jgi:mannose-1-phosphate guanylyltransferase
VTIVATQHEKWWRNEFLPVQLANIVVQPRNRGTAIGVLLPLLRILERDPDANVVLVPSDHFVADERVLARAVRDAMREVGSAPERAVLLGIVPDEPDTEFGWILPERNDGPGVRDVARFVEKPDVQVATRLMRRGGVWNSFIVVAAGWTLLEFFQAKLPGAIALLRTAVAFDSRDRSTASAIARAYEKVESFDFCRDVLEGLEDRLSVLPVPHCGWSDLGTPQRVARCIERIPTTPNPIAPTAVPLDLAHASLAAQQAPTA